MEAGTIHQHFLDKGYKPIERLFHPQDDLCIKVRQLEDELETQPIILIPESLVPDAMPNCSGDGAYIVYLKVR